MGADRSLRQYYPGDRILTEGESGTELFILMSGEVEVTRGRVRLGILRTKGDVIGEIAALTGRPRSATATAITEANLLAVPVEFKALSSRSPEVLEKIDGAIRLRYEVARNKALLYTRRAANARRSLLQEVLSKAELARVGKRVPEASVRKSMRRVVDDFVGLHGDTEDPRVLRKLADDYSVTTDYLQELAARAWLDEGLALRLNELGNHWDIIEETRTLPCLRDRAQITASAIDIIAEYEQTPGTMRALDLARLEEIVPFPSRSRIFRELLHARDAGDDAASRSWAEKKAQQAIEIAKANAGMDTPSLLAAARELGFAADYESELRRVVELTGTSASFVDLEIP